MLKGLKQPDYTTLTKNYLTRAEKLRVIKRFDESILYCRQVIKMEKENKIYSFEAMMAYATLMLISKTKGEIKEQLEYSWQALDRTLCLGDTNSCICYTTIIENVGEATAKEHLSLISFARRFTNPPEQTWRGI